MLELCTGCRLHFGLMELAAGQPNRFAGLGLMVQMPRVRVQAGPKQVLASRGATDADIDSRVRAAREHAQQTLRRELPADWTIAVVEHPRLHSGLGLGTQLAAAVAATAQLASLTPPAENASQQANFSWRRFATACPPAGITGDDAAVSSEHAEASAGQAEQVRALARLSGRGKRSAVGLHGFLFGGLVQDFGQSASHASDASPAERAARERTFGTRSCAFPDWSIVLLLSSEGGDMCGAAEERLIGQAGALPNPQRATMLELSEVCMSAAAAADFERFTDALERYMDIAATLFAPVQAGRYRDEQIAARVELAQRAGLRGVGQSSWGPTVFGLAQSNLSAQQIAERLRSELKNESVEVLVTQAANQGARWRPMATGVQHAG